MEKNGVENTKSLKQQNFDILWRNYHLRLLYNYIFSSRSSPTQLLLQKIPFEFEKSLSPSLSWNLITFDIIVKTRECDHRNTQHYIKPKIPNNKKKKRSKKQQQIVDYFRV